MPQTRFALILCLLLVSAACRHDVAPVLVPPPVVEVRLLALNDLHGYLQPSPSRTAAALLQRDEEIAAGGIIALAGAIERLQAGQPNTVMVAAGDLIGASPLSSALLRDEPAVQALGKMGLAYSAVGNHEFDRGRAELDRIRHGGCVLDGCPDGEVPFAGARFEYLAANVFDEETGERAFAAWRIATVGGVRIAFVGALVRSAPQIINAENIAGLRFEDEADSINAVVPEILAAGARAIVALIHEGAVPGPQVDPDTCDGLRGPLLDISERLRPEIDVVVSGHSHRAYVCRHQGRLLTQAGSYGQLLTTIDMQIDAVTGDVLATRAEQHLVDPARPSADPAYRALLEETLARSAAVARKPVARLGVAQLSRVPDANGESALGRVIADAQLHAARAQGAELACINPGGVRQDLPATPGDGTVTFGDAHATHPFGNQIVVLELSGQQLLALLEQQWKEDGPDAVMSCSRGFSYRFDATLPRGQRVRRETVSLDGEALDPRRMYRFACNSFIAGGGYGFTVLQDVPRVAEAGGDLDALVAYLQEMEPLLPPDDVRVQAGASE
jgi:5'-nucleotidase